VFGTSTNISGSTSTLPADDSDGSLYVFEIDCRARKRYLDLTATIGDGSTGGFATALAILSRGSNPGTSASDRGVAQILRV
jgi:hypothetical protein